MFSQVSQSNRNKAKINQWDLIKLTRFCIAKETKKKTKGTFLHCWWECKLVQPLWKTVWSYLRKLYIELLHDLAIPLLGIYPDKSFLKKDTCTRMFIAALFTIAKAWNQPRCRLTDDQIRKMLYIYTMEYYSAIKKNDIMPFAATWMELENLILSEMSQKDKDKYHMISLITGI